MGLPVTFTLLGLKQLKHRFSRITKIFTGQTTSLEVSNIIVLELVDIIAGSLVSIYLLAAFPNLFDVLLSRVESLLVIVLDLLQWLRGSPAGLKLNAALNSLLCRFFSYHLHLWRNYIGIVEPVLSSALLVVTYAGYVGLSIQIALLKDVLGVATFHIYCLYIYATRLFNVQRKTVISLGRLFFGKKWNPLRQRVDKVHLTISEMFLGSLGFTIAILLFPTTFAYYVVFLGLRIPVRLLEYVLKSTVDILNSLELVTAVLVCVNSSVVADDIYFKPTYSVINGESVVTFKLCTFSNRSAIRLPKIGVSFKQTLTEIYQGVVIQE